MIFMIQINSHVRSANFFIQRCRWILQNLLHHPFRTENNRHRARPCCPDRQLQVIQPFYNEHFWNLDEIKNSILCMLRKIESLKK